MRFSILPYIIQFVLVAMVFAVPGCSSDTNSKSIQMGGSIQGSPLALNGVVTTVAGIPPASDGVGSSARFRLPIGVTAVGNILFVTDSFSHSIRKIDISSGVVTTFAGKPGISGSQDGTGFAARFNNPSGITNDGINLYIADNGNHTIRKIEISSSVVSTVAGTAGVTGALDGTGDAARFYHPDGITTDGQALYITDSFNRTVRKISINSQDVTTFAGTAGAYGAVDDIGVAARFEYPNGITYVGGNLYVVDNGSNTIRMINVVTQAVSTIAGNSNASTSGIVDGIGTDAHFWHPSGIASDGSNLYVTEDVNTIRKIVIATREVSTIAGVESGVPGTSIDAIGTAARFYSPKGIVSVGAYLYVADTENNTIRKIDKTTTSVTTFAGTTDPFYGSTDATGLKASFYDTDGITTDGKSLYVVDGSTIRRFEIATGVVTTIAGTAGVVGSADGIGPAASFFALVGITTDGSNLYVTDNALNTIRKIDILTGVVTTLAGTAGMHGAADGIGPLARFGSLQGITSDGINLYVVDRENVTIRKIVVSTGAVTTLAGTAGIRGVSDGTGPAAKFYSLEGICTDGSNLYVIDGTTIRKIVISTGAVITFAGTANVVGASDGIGSAASFNLPYGITTDGTSLFVTERNNHTVRKIDIASGYVSTIAGAARTYYGWADGTGSDARFTDPHGITTDGTKLYVSDRYAIRMIY